MRRRRRKGRGWRGGGRRGNNSWRSRRRSRRSRRIRLLGYRRKWSEGRKGASIRLKRNIYGRFIRLG